MNERETRMVDILKDLRQNHHVIGVKAEFEAEKSKLAGEIEKYKDALIWCSGSDDFQIGGKARKGWEKIKKELLK